MVVRGKEMWTDQIQGHLGLKRFTIWNTQPRGSGMLKASRLMV